MKTKKMVRIHLNSGQEGLVMAAVGAAHSVRKK